MCNSYNINCYTFLQPFPGYLNVHQHNSMPDEDARAKHNQLKLGKTSRASNFIDITSALKGYKYHAYIDNVHYSPEANKLIANQIFSSIKDR